MTPQSLHSVIWNTIPADEREAFILLAIPVWFDRKLAEHQLTTFGKDTSSCLEKILRRHEMVFQYEERGWYLDRDFRMFLLNRDDFNLDVRSIHDSLIDHYRLAAGNNDCYGQREYVYLRLYHQLQADASCGLREIFHLYKSLHGRDRVRQSGFLVRVCETVPVKVESEPEYRVLKITMQLHSSCERKTLNGFLKELKSLERALDNTDLTEEIRKLLLVVLDHLPDSKSNRKLRDKIQKKLNIEKTALDFPDRAEQVGEEEISSQEKGSNRYIAEKVDETIAKITFLHRHSRHGDAWAIATKGRLVELQDGQKTYLCKSYCNIAGKIKNAPDSMEWRLKYFDLAIRANRYDPVPLTGKAELLSRLGRTKESEDLFDQAHRLDPNDVVALTGKAELLSRLGRTRESEDLFDQAHLVDPNNVVALNGKANLLSKNDRLPEAIEIYRTARKGSGRLNPYTLCGLAFLLLKRNRSEDDISEAASLFEEANRLTFNDRVVFLGLWVVYARLGNHGKAETYRTKFEACSQQGCSFETRLTDKEQSVFSEFEKIKPLIIAQQMMVQAQYKFIIGLVLAYAQLLLSNRWQTFNPTRPSAACYCTRD